MSGSEDEEDYVVEKVVRSRKKGGAPEYEIKWEGHDETSWVRLRERCSSPHPIYD
jgi:hypothetical protein